MPDEISRTPPRTAPDETPRSMADGLSETPRGRQMRKLTAWTGLKADDRGASVAIGNFDGVHLGHRAVLDCARRFADTGHPLGVVTFEPHPRQVFAPAAPPFRLMNAQTRANRLARLGVERLYQLPFDARLSQLSPDAFVREILHDGLGVHHVTVGEDFRFGHDRAGDGAMLTRLGEEMGFGVTLAPLVGRDGTRVSSSAIRKALGDGLPREAAMMLGHWHRIDGQVLGGDRRGREIGYPTANLSLSGLHLPRLGVYAVLVDVLSGPYRGHYRGAASIGVRPMFGEANSPNLEVFIFDFSGDLYDRDLSVALVEYLRPEEKFASIAGLVAQMDADCARARTILAAIEG